MRIFGARKWSMRKSVLGTATALEPVKDYEWLDLEYIARVEVTTEDPVFPIEAALNLKDSANGWRAATPGEQKIRILFDGPTLIHLIHLQFSEPVAERTQEFTLRWSGVDGPMQEIARQQWNFNPSGSTTEIENFRVNLAGVMTLELTVKPDISGGAAIASLARLRFA